MIEVMRLVDHYGYDEPVYHQPRESDVFQQVLCYLGFFPV